MSNWLDLSDNANCFESMYVKGFVDISGGSLQLRNSDNHLLVGGDSSFNGGVYLEQNLLIGTETGHSGYAADISGIVDISGNLFTQGDVSMNGNLYVSGDCNIDGALSFGSASISASNISFSSDISLNERLFVNVSDVSYIGISGYLTEIEYPQDASFIKLGPTIFGTDNNDAIGEKRNTAINNNGDIIAVGAAYNDSSYNINISNIGEARIYKFNGSTWSLMGPIITGDNTNELNGFSVSLNGTGTIVAVGSIGYNNYGRVRIFEYNSSNNTWDNLGQIDGESLGEDFGTYTVLNESGDRIAISASKNSSNGSKRGMLRIYQYNGGTSWTKMGDISGEGNEDRADVIAMNNIGDIVAFGAMQNDGTGITDCGHVRIFQYNGGTSWIQLGQDIDGGSAQEFFGTAVDLNKDGTIVTIGAIQYDHSTDTNLSNCGLTRIYKFNSSNNIWNQLGNDIIGIQTTQLLGISVSSNNDGNLIATGSIAYDSPGMGANGRVDIYQYDDISWNLLTSIDGEQSNDQFGRAALLTRDGTKIIIGTPNRTYTTRYGYVNIYKIDHTINNIPIYQKIHSDVGSSGTFSSDISLNNSLIVPSNITIVDSSSNNYGSYTVYTDKAATNFFSVGKSASNVFNIVDQDNAGVYMASGSTSLTSTSDARLKTAIEPLEDATDKLMQLKPCTYKWKTQDEADTKKHVGFIAQEVEALFPNLVNENTYPDGSTYKGVATTDLIPYLLKTCISMDEQLSKMKEYIKSKKST